MMFHVNGVESTPAAEEALKAWLAANTPSQPGRGSAYTGSQTPGQMLATPAMQGLLQQLRISTPTLGAHVCRPHVPTLSFTSCLQCFQIARTSSPCGQRQKYMMHLKSYCALQGPHVLLLGCTNNLSSIIIVAM